MTGGFLSQSLMQIPYLLMTLVVMAVCIYFLIKKMSAGVLLILFGKILGLCGSAFHQYFIYQIMVNNAGPSSNQVFPILSSTFLLISTILFTIGLIVVLLNYLKLQQKKSETVAAEGPIIEST